MVKCNSEKFILASASPRRKELLTQAGYSFDVVVSNIDERLFDSDGLSPTDYAGVLAMAKAQDVSRKFPNKIVVGADTIADFDGQIIGKADDEAHAAEITGKLFSAPHKIITALAMVSESRELKILDCDITIVYPKVVSQAKIAEYLTSGQWKGRAGAYGIKEKDDPFVERIEGSLTNVMGLGMEMFEKMFSEISGRKSGNSV